MALGNNLLQFRHARGLSLGQLSIATGIDKAYLHRIERERCGCSDEVKMKLSLYFGVPVTRLFFQEVVDFKPTAGTPA